MKKLIVLLSLGLILVGCGSKKPETPETPETPDTNSVASITDQGSVLADSLGANGNWITAATADIIFDSALTVDGEFHDKGDAKNAVYRKLALHTQDDKFNIIDNFTLTTPKLVVKSENFTVFYGTIKGDVEVHADGFTLVGTKVEGNVIFASEENKNSADLDKDAEGAEISGEVSVQ